MECSYYCSLIFSSLDIVLNICSSRPSLAFFLFFQSFVLAFHLILSRTLYMLISSLFLCDWLWLHYLYMPTFILISARVLWAMFIGCGSWGHENSVFFRCTRIMLEVDCGGVLAKLNDTQMDSSMYLNSGAQICSLVMHAVVTFWRGHLPLHANYDKFWLLISSRTKRSRKLEFRNLCTSNVEQAYLTM